MYTLVLQKSVGILTPCKFHVRNVSGFRHFVYFCLQKIFYLSTKVLHPTVGKPTPLTLLFPEIRET
jgi:tetrahydromethanopterin S-methyltransferase subunit E